MPFFMVRNDITKMPVDAVVNAANSTLLGGGGVDGAIHKAAGPKLLEECRQLRGCEVGDAKVTGGYDMPCRYIIHTVGPVWNGGGCGEAELLASCYERSLEAAKSRECSSVAFPLISSGAYGYPKKDAIEIAERTIRKFLDDNDMTVYLVLFDSSAMAVLSEKHRDIMQYIDDRYADNAVLSDIRRLSPAPPSINSSAWQPPAPPMQAVQRSDEKPEKKKTLFGLFSRKCDTQEKEESAVSDLEAALKMKDESFAEALFRLIDSRGLSDAQVYKRANIDRRLFSKIRCDSEYKPKKQTAAALAIALELSIGETEELLGKAGYSLSNSLKFDLIIRYFITRGSYDIYEINEALFAFDQPLIGA